MIHRHPGGARLCAAAALCLLAGCGGGGGDESGTEPIEGDSVTIYSSLARNGPAREQTRAIENGARLALAERRGRVGRYRVRYRALDDSDRSSGAPDEGRARRNARTAIGDRSTVGYIGEQDSVTSKVTIPTLNQAGIAQVSPTNTYVGLTTDERGSEPGEPGKYYPADERTFARIVPRDTVQARALLRAAREAGCRRLRVWHTETTYASGLAGSIERFAGEAGVAIAGKDEVDPQARDYRALAEAIDADCLAWTGEAESNGAQVLADAGASSRGLRIFAADAHCGRGGAAPRTEIPRSIATRFRCTFPILGPDALEPAGRRVLERYRSKHGSGEFDAYAVYGYEAMALLLDAVERGGEGQEELTPARVVDALLDTESRASPLGTYSIDSNGDTSLTRYGLYRLDGGQVVFDSAVDAGAG